MASVKALVRMKRAGVYHPPGTVFHDFDLDEAEGLKGKVAILDRGDAPPPAAEFIAADLGSGLGLNAETARDDVPPNPVPAQGSGGTSERVAEVMEAFDLLDAADWTQGDRPCVEPLSAVLGYVPTEEEIDAALSLREAMQ